MDPYSAQDRVLFVAGRGIAIEDVIRWEMWLHVDDAYRGANEVNGGGTDNGAIRVYVFGV